MRSPNVKPLTHEMCLVVAQRMNEAAQIGETVGRLPQVFNSGALKRAPADPRCIEPAAVVL
jgi:hypothetical protein